LRNDTAGLLRRVEAGESMVITRRGKPVAQLVPHSGSEPRWLTPSDVLAVREITAGDPDLATDLQRLAGETTEELGPID
jgi:prevent-host-death family protein